MSISPSTSTPASTASGGSASACERITVPQLRARKGKSEKIVMVTAYDAPTASVVDEAGVDVVLVGDSLGNVIQGRPDTLGVTMDEMIYHTTMVSRAVRRAAVVADMPFMSYQASTADALRNAGRFLKETGAAAVKLEVNEHQLDTVRALVGSGIPVMGHIGLCPQSIHLMGGYRVQGRTEEDAGRLTALAEAIEQAGAFSLVLESIPRALAAQITAAVGIPTIGIGAGPDCDGQVLVLHDLVGLTAGPVPRFVKRYADVRKLILEAVEQYACEVREGRFPGPENCYD